MNIPLVIILIGVGFLFHATVLYLTSKIFKVANVSYKKSLSTTVLVYIITSIIELTFGYGQLQIIGFIVSIVASYFAVVFCYRKFYSASWGKSIGIYTVSVISVIIITVIVAIPLRLFLFEPFVVNGSSMSPHYNAGDYLMIQKIDRDFQRDNVIVYKVPTGNGFGDSEVYYIKRIIGLPGEKIDLKNGTLSINGVQFSDTNIVGKITGALSVSLGNNEYFVLGDNIASSSDSRMTGPVNESKIVGKIGAEWNSVMGFW